MAPLLRSMAAVACLAGLGLSGCGGGGSSGGAACGPATREALDSNQGHVLVAPGAPEPSYLTDPPTSGPHTPGATPTGLVASPLSRPVQVGALEAGVVLVQYKDPADLDALRPLATGRTVVAPNPSLPARVVATAWLFKQTCSAVDADALTRFATDHAGHGPGADG